MLENNELELPTQRKIGYKKKQKRRYFT